MTKHSTRGTDGIEGGSETGGHGQAATASPAQKLESDVAKLIETSLAEVQGGISAAASGAAPLDTASTREALATCIRLLRILELRRDSTTSWETSAPLHSMTRNNDTVRAWEPLRASVLATCVSAPSSLERLLTDWHPTVLRAVPERRATDATLWAASVCQAMERRGLWEELVEATQVVQKERKEKKGRQASPRFAVQLSLQDHRKRPVEDLSTVLELFEGLMNASVKSTAEQGFSND